MSWGVAQILSSASYYVLAIVKLQQFTCNGVLVMVYLQLQFMSNRNDI